MNQILENQSKQLDCCTDHSRVSLRIFSNYSTIIGDAMCNPTPDSISILVFVEEYVTTQLDELLTDKETLDDILMTIQAQANLSDIEREQLMDVARVETDAVSRYRMIPKQDSREGYRDMQEYIWTLEGEHLSELLEVAIQECAV